ncbi:MAG TPA: EF-hand domain-containing protein [Pelomicrobium sp.]|nr:EF-hand domain-containing protein [Pelomicrobium sp.]
MKTISIVVAALAFASGSVLAAGHMESGKESGTKKAGKESGMYLDTPRGDFREFDKDGDGFLNAKEAKAARVKIPLLDTNNDGKISAEEWTARTSGTPAGMAPTAKPAK